MSNTKNEIRRLRRAAGKGDVFALVQLAAMLATGDGLTQDLAQAASLYAAATKQGSAEAAFNLATMYARGEGVAKSWLKALALYRKAERLGSSDASITLGELALKDRDGSPADPGESLQHFALAAANRDVRGLFLAAMTLQAYPCLPTSAVVEALLEACAKKGSKEAKGEIRRLRAKAHAR